MTRYEKAINEIMATERCDRIFAEQFYQISKMLEGVGFSTERGKEIYSALDALRSAPKCSVGPTSDLRALCIKKNWFTCGTNEQYAKLFYANSHGCPMEEIATVIWICSDDERYCRRDILADLKEAREDWAKSLLPPTD